ncbi:MAG: phosphoribosyltransferase family protein [Pseudomonadota bacterium]
MVGGLDAMGFVLGAAIAARRDLGFLPIRKAGKLCVDTDKVSFSDYSGQTQDMEMRRPAFAPGTRVLLVDQWIETGGTMDGAIRLVERQKGVVTALVAIAMEAKPGATALRERFPVVTAIQPNTDWQSQCNAQTLESFEAHEAKHAFPLA